MVGYGFVRSSGGASLARQTRGSAAVASATTSYADAPPEAPLRIPESADDRKRQLDLLYDQIEELKGRNKEVWKEIQAIMERAAASEDDSANAKSAVQDAERLLAGAAGLPTVSSAADKDPLLGGVADSAAALIAEVNSRAVAEGIAPVTAATSTAAPPAVEADTGGIPMRPSGGASRLGSPMSSMDVTPSALYNRGVTPERPGGASVRSGPGDSAVVAAAAVPPAAVSSLTLGSSPDSSRVPPEEEGSPSSRSPLVPSPEGALTSPAAADTSAASASPAAVQEPALAAWAGAAVEAAVQQAALPRGSLGASPSTPTRSTRSGSPGSGSPGERSPSTGPQSSRAVRELVSMFDNPLAAAAASPPSPPAVPAQQPSPPAERLRPSLRPTRRTSGAGAARQPRTYRAIPPAPTRTNPSFDVPENALPAEEYLKEMDARTADGRFNPSFALATAPAPAAAAAPAAPPATTAPTTPAPAAAEVSVNLLPPQTPLAVEEDEEEPMAAVAFVPEAPAAAAPSPAPPLEAPSPPPSASYSSFAAASAAPLRAEPQPQAAWYNPLSWFTQRSTETQEGGERSNPSFDASLAVTADPAAAPLSEAAAPPSVEAVAPPSVEAVVPPSVEAVVPPSVEAAAPSSVEVVVPPSVEAAAPSSVVVVVPPSIEAAAPLSLEASAPQLAMPPATAAPQEATALAPAELPSLAASTARPLAVVGEAAAESAVTSKLEALVRAAEEQAADRLTPAGVGAAAAESAAAWSEALTEGARPGDFGPVERVVELLEVAMETSEFADPKYDPLRDTLAAGASGPTAAHKYDLLRGLERAGKEAVEQEAAAEVAVPEPGAEAAAEAVATAAAHDAGVGEASAQQKRPVYKYDLLYDLLQSVRTSGDPAAILAASDPKYDPVWSLLKSEGPARGSVSKYDMVGSLLKAALAASPQPSRYDPVQAILQARPITGSYKYCLAEVVLRGGWQQPLGAGLGSLPSWDPMAAVVGSEARGRAAAASQQRRAATLAATGRRRVVSKYDMVGQALEAAASLPEELASGRWAASQPRDLLLKPRGRTEAPRIRPPRSKYDMVGQALDAAASLPEELASGKWAASQGRELLIDTASKSINEGSWGFVRRIRNGGAMAIKAVSTVAHAGGNLIAKAAGRPYEIAPGVVIKVEQPRRPSPGRASAAGGGPVEVLTAALATAVGAAPPDATEPAVESGPRTASVPWARAGSPARTSSPPVSEQNEELPTLVFQFKNGEGASRSSPRGGSEKAAGGQVTVTARRKGRGNAPPTRSVVPELEMAAAVPSPSNGPAAALRLERAVVPPSRQAGWRVTAAQQAATVVPSLPHVDESALVAALAAAEELQDVQVDEQAHVAAVPHAAAAAEPVHVPEPAEAVVASAAAAEEDLQAEVAAETEPVSAAQIVVPATAAETEVQAFAAEALPDPWAAATTAPEPVVEAPPAAVEAPATSPATPASTAAAAPAAPAPAQAAPTSSRVPMTPSEMAIDLLVVMSVQGPRGAARPTMESLLDRFGDSFAAVVAQLRALRADAALMAGHPAIERLVRAASDAGDGTGMWSHLYEMLGAVREAEAALPRFLKAVQGPYPQVHALLATGDVGQGVSVLCTLCNLLPGDRTGSPP